MSTGTLHPLAEEYLQRLRRAGRELPRERLRELLTEIEGHLAEAIPPGAPDQAALEVLERLGEPADIVEAEEPYRNPPHDRRSWREWTAVILLPLGGFVFGIGWIVGLIFLWSSRLWTTRDKLIGTLIIPGGLAIAPFVLLLAAGSSGSSGPNCSGQATEVNAVTGAVIHRGTFHCVGSASAGVSPLSTALSIALLMVVVIGPIASAVYLARRAR